MSLGADASAGALWLGGADGLVGVAGAAGGKGVGSAGGLEAQPHRIKSVARSDVPWLLAAWLIVGTDLGLAGGLGVAHGEERR
ncbi:MAG: hypothetical protein O7A98_07915 [Acidobacteria bacterium]|nr:hypothetical protein [Acidobacteriota bacterium]